MRRASDPRRILIRAADRGNMFKLPEMDGHREGSVRQRGLRRLR